MPEGDHRALALRPFVVLLALFDWGRPSTSLGAVAKMISDGFVRAYDLGMEEVFVQNYCKY